jgi:CHASE2 domain-containing sensor protein
MSRLSQLRFHGAKVWRWLNERRITAAARVRRMRQRVTLAWQKMTARQRHFAINAGIGIVISIALLPLEGNAAVENVRDFLLRWQTAQFANSDIGRDIVWLDIDEDTFIQWHAPLITPRDRLCRLIDFAVRSQARVVVVDVALDERSPIADRVIPCDSRDGPTATDAQSPDVVLSTYLHRYARECSRAAHRCPLVILARTTYQSYQFRQADGEQARAVRPTFLDVTPFASSSVIWGAVGWDPDEDGVIRRWRPTESLCGPASALASIEILAARAYRGGNISQLQSELNVAYRPSCVPQEIWRRNHTVSSFLTAEGEPHRFFYRIGWDRAAHRARMNTIPARLVTDTNGSFDSSLTRDRIVVIGGSYPDNPDFHPTPLGLMPGTLVLINAINSLLLNDRVKAPSIAVRILIEAALVMALSALFLYLRPAAAMWIGLASLAAATLTLGFVFLNSGYWVDPVLPLLAILCKEVVSQVSQLMRKRESL